MTSVDTGEPNAAADRAPGARPPVSRWRALALSWRDWSLATKLVALMAVPTLVVVVLGAVLVSSQVAEADSAKNQAKLAGVTTDIRKVVADLSQLRATGLANVPPDAKSVRALRSDAGQLREGASKAGLDGPASESFATAQDRLRAVTAAADGQSPVDADTYASAIGALLRFQSVLANEGGDSQLAPVEAAVYRLDSAREEVSLQQANLGSAASKGGMNAADQGRLRASNIRYASDIDEFRAVSQPATRKAYDAATQGGPTAARTSLVQSVLSEDPAAGGDPNLVPVRATTSRINAQSTATTAAISKVSNRLAGTLESRGAALADSTSNKAGITLVLLVLALMVSAAIAIVIVRQLLGSLRALRGGAAAAEADLPRVVRDVRAGRQVDTEVEPIDVDTREEIGQLARAFDKVHGQAVRLAVEQAGLRAEYSSLFVNLSRRSQTLVQRQLRLIERLERDEEDAEQLDTLFQLDHLATRMRRNNENLIVLSGGELGRGANQTLAVADLLRAASSEIEQYQRVTVESPENVTVVGYAASDLVRMVAELLDNATSFSAPSTPVALSCDFATDGGLRIAIADEGIGMTDADLDTANRQLQAAQTEEMPAARRMGLFVVGRLAAQYGVGVSLHARDGDNGLRAEILLPASLVNRAELASPDRGEIGGAATAAADPVVDTDTALLAGTEPAPRPDVPPQPDALPQDTPAQPDMPLPSRQRGLAARLAGMPLTDDAAGDNQADEMDLFAPVPEDAGEDMPAAGPAAEEGLEPPEDEVAAAPDAAQAPSMAGAALFAPTVDEPSPPPEPDVAAPPQWSDGHESHGSTRYRLVGTGRGPRPEQPAASRPADVPGHPAPAVNGHAPAMPGDVAARREDDTTPIFDEMSSAWFVDATESTESPLLWPDDSPVTGDPSVTPGAWSPADSGWREADAVARSTPTAYTDAGLPVRTPKARLVPGSMAAGEEPAAAPQQRDADRVRDRYSSFLRGLADGKRELDEPQAAGEQAPDEQPVDEQAADEQAADEQAAPEQPAAVGDTAPPSAPEQHSAPERDTPSPLPRRVPGKNLGGAITTRRPEPNGHTPQAPSTPDTEPAAASLFDADTPAPSSGTGPAQPPPLPDPGPAASEVTSVGLPKRRRGAQLIPRENGSGAEIHRDSERVRDRMSSLQRGVTRGWRDSEQAHTPGVDNGQENE